MARLEHPHIVPLYDFWREPGGAYLVFRLLRGGTAEQELAFEGRVLSAACDDGRRTDRRRAVVGTQRWHRAS